MKSEDRVTLGIALLSQGTLKTVPSTHKCGDNLDKNKNTKIKQFDVFLSQTKN